MPRILSLRPRETAAGSVKATLADADGWRDLFGLDDRRAETLAPARQWQLVSFVRRCISVRARAAAAVPFGLYPEGETDPQAALYTEADEPPPGYAALEGLREARWRAESSFALSGACYFVILRDLPGRGRRLSADNPLGRFKGLQYCAPGTVEPRITPQGIQGFYRTVNGSRVPYDAEAMLHAYVPDPFAEIGAGTSDAHAAGTPAQVLSALQGFLADHLSNGLTKMTVLTGAEGAHLTLEQAEQAKEKWWHFLTRRGSRTEGPPVLDGLTPTVIGEGVKELDDASLTEGQQKAIAAAFGVPHSVVMSDAANYATAAVDERAFLLQTVFPQARLFADALNRQVLSGYGLHLRLHPERHEVMQQYELETAGAVQKLVGRPVLSLNEGRALIGKEAVEGGDEIATNAPATAVTVNNAAPERDRQPDDDGPSATDGGNGNDAGDGGDGATRSLPTVAVSPPVIDAEALTAAVRRALASEREAEAKAVADWKAQAWVATDALKTEATRPLRRRAEDYLAALIDALAEALDTDDAIAALASFDLGAWAARLDAEVRPAVMSALERGFERGAFNADTVLPWDPEDGKIVSAANRLLGAAEGVPETVRAQAETAVRGAIEEGLERDEIVRAVREALSDVPATRARLIAQTTGTGAFEAGQASAYEEAGITHVLWLTQRDGAVRDEHAAMDAEEVPVGSPFSNGLMYPGDPAGDPASVCNCRCSTLPVMRDGPNAYARSVRLPDAAAPEADAEDGRNAGAQHGESSRAPEAVATGAPSTWAQRKRAWIYETYKARRAEGEERPAIIEDLQEGAFEGEPYAHSYDTVRKYVDQPPE